MTGITKFLTKETTDLAKALKVSTSTIAEYCGITWVMNAPVPNGLILPWYDSGGAPSGWTLFTSAANKYILGATDSIGSTGGSLTISGTLVGAGSHNPSTAIYGTGAGKAYTNSVGTHQHTFSFDYYAKYRDFQLIKAGASAGTTLPAKAVAMAVQSLTGLTNLLSGDNRLFRSAADLNTGGGSASAVTSSTSGSHNHGTTWGQAAGTEGDQVKHVVNNQGAHTHQVSFSNFADGVKRRRVTLWYDAANPFTIQQGMIGMYESLTPPTGWALCDGNGGTPDFRSYFVEISDTTNDGTSAGNNTVQYDYSTNSIGHNHDEGSNTDSTPRSAKHTSTSSHSHSKSAEVASYTPPYYTLAFIIYTG